MLDLGECKFSTPAWSNICCLRMLPTRGGVSPPSKGTGGHNHHKIFLRMLPTRGGGVTTIKRNDHLRGWSYAYRNLAPPMVKGGAIRPSLTHSRPYLNYPSPVSFTEFSIVSHLSSLQEGAVMRPRSKIHRRRSSGTVSQAETLQRRKV